jgi:hypothetical protein
MTAAYSLFPGICQAQSRIVSTTVFAFAKAKNSLPGVMLQRVWLPSKLDFCFPRRARLPAFQFPLQTTPRNPVRLALALGIAPLLNF